MKLCYASLLGGWLLCVLGISSAKAAMIFDAYTPNVHNRFDSTAFIGAAFDWNGVGRGLTTTTEGETIISTWATMITPRHFISANHSHPGIGQNVAFWQSNTSSETPTLISVSAGQRIENTDIWLGELSEAIPSGIAIYDIAPSATIGVSGMGAYANELIYTVGVGGTLGFAVGQNRYDVADTTPPILGDFDAIGFIQDIADDTNFIPMHETYLQGGDSGAPSFIAADGTLQLAGIHSYISVGGVNESDFLMDLDFKTPEASIVMTNERDLSVDTFVANYQSQIFAAVPETSAAVLVMIPLALLFTWQFRVAIIVKRHRLGMWIERTSQ